MASPLELLGEALASPVGIVITTSDPERLRQALYRARASDPGFALLSIVTSRTAPASEVWIVKKGEPDAA